MISTWEKINHKKLNIKTNKKVGIKIQEEDLKKSRKIFQKDEK